MTLMAQVDKLPLCADPRAPKPEDCVGPGCLLVEREGRRVALPLESVAFRARACERVAHVDVEQTFANPFAELLEAVYIFPLSGGAAVSSFELRVGDKVLKGLVEERGEARRRYVEAVAQGKRAALLEQERDDVFTVRVGNIPPSTKATVKLTYAERLPAFDDGETELRIPLVVAPRYMPGTPLERASLGDGTESDTTAVPDASRISPPRLVPGLKSGVGLAIDVEIDARGGDLSDLECTQHATRLGIGAGGFKVGLARDEELLDRDFVLRWRQGGADTKPVVLVHRKGNDVFGLVSIVPPRNVTTTAPRDIVFVLDRSGSMKGEKMASARRACAALLDTLGPKDRFAVCAFDDAREWTWGKPELIAADATGVRDGKRFLDRIDARNGTELEPALEETFRALRLSITRREEQRLMVVVLITDGQVGNEGQILLRVEKRLEGLRVFTLGIDSAVNSAFLRRLAQLGRGTCQLCEPGGKLEAALDRIGREIGAPVLVDLEVDGDGLSIEKASLTPERLPDLYAGRAASVFFRAKNVRGAVKLRGRKPDGSRWEVEAPAVEVDVPALASLWAKSRVGDLEDRYRLAYEAGSGGLEDAKGEIIRIALDHSILTRFTAFVVVDEQELPQRLAKRTVVQPVEQPAQWEHGNADVATKAIDPFAAMPPAGLAFAPPPMRAGSAMKKTQSIAETGAFPAPAARGAPPPPPANPPGFSARSRDATKSESHGGFGAPPSADSGDALQLGEASPANEAPAGGGAFHAQPSGAADPFAGETEAFELMEEAEDELILEDSTTDTVVNLPAKASDGLKLSQSGATPVPPEYKSVIDRWLAEQQKAPAKESAGLLGKIVDAIRGAPPPSPAGFASKELLAQRVDALGKALDAAVAAVERGGSVDTDDLDRKRLEVLATLWMLGLERSVPRLVELLARTLGDTIAAIRAGRRLEPARVRELAQAFAAQARSELAPFVGRSGEFWGASI